MPITLHLDAETEKRLKEAAAARGVTPEAFAQEAIEAWSALGDEALDGQENDIAADEAAIAQYERDGLAVPGEDVVAWLKSLQTNDPLPEPQARKLK